MSSGKRYFLVWITVFMVLPLISFWSGYFTASHSEPPDISNKDKTIIMDILKSAVHKEIKSVPEEFSNRDLNLPLFVTLLYKGEIIRICTALKTDLRKSLEYCRDELASGKYPENSRIRVDIAYSKVRLFNIPLLRRLLILPGIEALAAKDAYGNISYVLPVEMYVKKLLSGGKPVKFIPELSVGINFSGAVKELEKHLHSKPVSFYRVALLSLVDTPEGFADVFRENLDKRPKVNGKNVYKAAIRGGMYMVRALIKNKNQEYPCENCRSGFFRTDSGQFIYNYHLISGKADFQNRYIYNLPRHAGTTYAVANLYRITKIPVFKHTAAKAIDYLNFMASGKCNGPGFRCVSNRRMANLGSSALTLVALTEYRLATGDEKYDEFIKKLAAFLLYMQRNDGSFNHVYDSKLKKPDSSAVLLYYSGEAALALAKTYQIFKEKKYAVAVEKALDWLTTEQVKPLPFRFAFGEEHWTCQAARAIWPAVKKRRYLNFCLNFAKYIKRQQFSYGEVAFDDFAGGYGFSPFIPVHVNGAGSRTESNVSTLELAGFYSVSTEALKKQILSALGHILRHQRIPLNCWLCADPKGAEGAIANSPVNLTVRIDTVQHTTTGLIRAWNALFNKKRQ